MVNPYRFYTYAYLREDRTPYYIGKGRGNRAYYKYKGTKPPKDKSRILFLKQNLTEEESFKHERYMIGVFGRKDLGTGILINKTDGGDGNTNMTKTKPKGCKHKVGLVRPGARKPKSPEHRAAISAALKGKHFGPRPHLIGKTGPKGPWKYKVIHQPSN